MHGSPRGGEREVVFLKARREQLQRGVGQRGRTRRVHQDARRHGSHDVFGRVQFERARVEARRRRRGEQRVHHVGRRRDAQEHADRKRVGCVAQREQQVTEHARVETLGVLHDDRHGRGGQFLIRAVAAYGSSAFVSRRGTVRASELRNVSKIVLVVASPLRRLRRRYRRVVPCCSVLFRRSFAGERLGDLFVPPLEVPHARTHTHLASRRRRRPRAPRRRGAARGYAGPPRPAPRPPPLRTAYVRGRVARVSPPPPPPSRASAAATAAAAAAALPPRAFRSRDRRRAV